MRNRLFKLMLVAAAAAGGVAFWQRRNETPPFDPGTSRGLRPSEPFMDPATKAPASADAAEVDAAEEDAADVHASVVDVADVEAAADDASEAEQSDDSAPTPRHESIRPAEIDTSELPVIDGPEQAPLPQPPHRPFTTAPDGPADDLKLISGIGPKLEQTLNEEGITTYAQLGALDDAEVNALQARLGGVAGRVRRENWVSQAAELAG